MNRNRAIAVVACALVALAVAVFSTTGDPVDPIAEPEPATAPEPVAEPPSPRDVRIEAVGDSTPPVPSGGTLVVSRSSLDPSRPLVVKLQLEKSEDPAEKLSARIFTEGRQLALSASVIGEASKVAQVEIDSEWLTQGRHVIEIRTSERSHFPLRRYAVEVE